MSAHTPGPWRFRESKRRRLIIVNQTDFVLAVVPANRPSGDANAQLMTAAPELLKACHMALNDRMYADWPHIANALMAAIAKAERAK